MMAINRSLKQVRCTPQDKQASTLRCEPWNLPNGAHDRRTDENPYTSHTGTPCRQCSLLLLDLLPLLPCLFVVGSILVAMAVLRRLNMSFAQEVTAQPSFDRWLPIQQETNGNPYHQYHRERNACGDQSTKVSVFGSIYKRRQIATMSIPVGKVVGKFNGSTVKKVIWYRSNSIIRSNTLYDWRGTRLKDASASTVVVDRR